MGRALVVFCWTELVGLEFLILEFLILECSILEFSCVVFCFIMKGCVNASMKKKNYFAYAHVKQDTGEVAYANCNCKAEREDVANMSWHCHFSY